MQDRVVIFDSMVGFFGTIYLTASFKFTPGWPYVVIGHVIIWFPGSLFL